MSKVLDKIENYFGIERKYFLKEILCGLLAFLPMIYILPIIANSLVAVGINSDAAFLASAISSAISCILIGLLIRKPLAQTIGLGVNAFFIYTICGEMNYSASEGLLIIFTSSILFLILSLTPIRKMLINSMPKEIKGAISIGLGGFLIYSGIRSAGIIVINDGNISFSSINYPIVLLAIFGIIFTLFLVNIKGKIKSYGVLVGILTTAVLGVILGVLGVDNMPSFNNKMIDLANIKTTFFCFTDKIYIFKDIRTYFIILVLTFMNIFDTGVGLLVFEKELGICDNDGIIRSNEKIFLPDAIGSIVSTSLGSTTITTVAESKIAYDSGAKSGITSIVLGVLFLISIFLYPIFSIFSGVIIDGVSYNPVTSVGVVAIGYFLVSQITSLNWKNIISVISTFVTLIFEVLFYSIPNGVGAGIICYTFLMLITCRGKELAKPMYYVSLGFIIYFVIILIL